MNEEKNKNIYTIPLIDEVSAKTVQKLFSYVQEQALYMVHTLKLTKYY